MINQLKVEFYKLTHSVMLYVIGVLYFIMGIIVPFKIVKLFNVDDIYYPFQDALQDVSCVFLTAILVAWFIGQDYSNRVFQHEIANGYSRFSVIISRLIPITIASVVMHAIIVSSEVLGTGILVGFSSSSFSGADVLWVLTVILQIVALVCVFAFISFVSGSQFAATAGTVVFEIFFCNIMRNFLRSGVYTYTCLCFAKDNTNERLSICAISAVATIVVVLFLTYCVFKKKEL